MIDHRSYADNLRSCQMKNLKEKTFRPELNFFELPFGPEFFQTLISQLLKLCV